MTNSIKNRTRSEILSFIEKNRIRPTGIGGLTPSVDVWTIVINAERWKIVHEAKGRFTIRGRAYDSLESALTAFADDFSKLSWDASPQIYKVCVSYELEEIRSGERTELKTRSFMIRDSHLSDFTTYTNPSYKPVKIPRKKQTRKRPKTKGELHKVERTGRYTVKKSQIRCYGDIAVKAGQTQLVGERMTAEETKAIMSMYKSLGVPLDGTGKLPIEAECTLKPPFQSDAVVLTDEYGNLWLAEAFKE